MKSLTGLALLLVACACYATETGRIRHLCSTEQGDAFFSQTFRENCRVNVLEEGWFNFAFTPNVIVDTRPSGTVREKDGVKLWTQFVLSSPLSSEDDEWQYDGMRGVSKFYCRKRQTRLIQATYFLAGSKVHERLSPRSILEEIEPGTLNEKLYLSVCKR